MSDNTQISPVDILLASAVKSMGKREVLKAIEKMFGVKNENKPKQKGGNVKKEKKERKPRQKADVPVTEERCVARVKGSRSGIKVGRHVLFESSQCDRKEVSGSEHLCAIHSNQARKFGDVAFGKATEPLTEEQKKMFVET